MLLNRVWPSKRQILNGLILALIVSLAITAAAIAGNMHFTSGGGNWSSPFHFTADVVGVGNEGYVQLELQGKILAICENKGGKDAPGQYYVDAQVTSLFGPKQADQNGHAHFDEFVPEPTYTGGLDPVEAGCPNGNWTVLGYLAHSQVWTDAYAYAISEPSGEITDTLHLTCTATVHADYTTEGMCVQD